MPTVSHHGGGCCGIRHIRGFAYYGTSVDRDLEDVRRIIEQRQYHSPGHLLEIVLNSSQLGHGRAKGLIDMGFRLVSRFKNPTGVICCVFHYSEAWRYTKPRAKGVPRPLVQPLPEDKE